MLKMYTINVLQRDNFIDNVTSQNSKSEAKATDSSWP